MAKMQKLDQKQVPQVIGLGVISVGVFGYALFNFVLGGPKHDAGAPTQKVDASASSSSAHAASTTAAVSTAAGAAENGTAGPGGVQMAQNTAPAMQLPGQYNPDPFRSPIKADAPVNIAPKAAGSSPAAKKALALPNATGVPAPGAQGGLSPVEAEAEREAREKAEKAKEQARLLAAARAVRPEIVVRGTSVVDGMCLAILEVGQEHRVVQVGDLLDKDFRVKKIKLEGIEVTGDQGKDKFFVPVGAKSEQKKPDNGVGSATQL